MHPSSYVPRFLMWAEQLLCLSTSSVTLKSQYLEKITCTKTSSWKSQQGHLLADDWACVTRCYLNRIKHPEQMMEGERGACFKVPFSRKIPDSFPSPLIIPVPRLTAADQLLQPKNALTRQLRGDKGTEWSFLSLGKASANCLGRTSC